MKNKILSMTLCAALIFTMLATPQIQPPAHAEAVTLTATVIAVAVTLIVAAGVTWTSVAMGKQCTTQFLTDKPEAKQIVEDIVAAMPQTGVLVLTKTMLPKVKQFMQMVGEYFKGKTAVSVPDPNPVFLTNGSMTVLSDTVSTVADDSSLSYSIYQYTVFDNLLATSPISLTAKNGDVYRFGLVRTVSCSYYDLEWDVLFSSGQTVHIGCLQSDCYCLDTTGKSVPWKALRVVFGFKLIRDNGNCFLNPYCIWYGFDYYGKAHSKFQTFNRVLCDDYNRYLSFPINLSDFQPTSVSIPTSTIGLDNIDDINEAIAHSVGQAAEGVKVDIQKLIEEIEAAKEDALPWTVEGVRELIGIQDELKEIAREQERIRDAIKEGTKEDDMSVPQLPTTITEKFPFCVPFDLIALAKTFSAEPVAPKVTIPVVFESMHYSHDFVFDFSGDNWDKVAAVIRWGTLIFFILGLTLVTRKLIKG